MSRREYLEWIMETALGKKDYDKEQVSQQVYSKYDANQEQFTEEVIAEYLRDFLGKEKLSSALKTVRDSGFWSTNAEDDDKLCYLRWKLAIALGDKYNQHKAEKEVYQVYEQDPSSYRSEKLVAFLSQFIEKERIGKLLDELEASKFWAQDIVDPSTYLNEQEVLDNYIADYRLFPSERKEKMESKGQTGRREPCEKILYRCLIMSLLYEHDKGVIKAEAEEFRTIPNLEQIKVEAIELKKCIEMENRWTPKIAKSLEQVGNFQPHVSKGKNSHVQSVYDNFSAIKKELILIDVQDLKRLTTKTEAVENEIDSKSIVLFLGETGSGKTTTIKALLGYKMGKKKYKGMTWVTIVEEVTDKKVLEMHANPSSKSVTRYLVAVKPKSKITTEDIYLTDTPGWGDTAGLEVQLANIIGVRRALRGCRKVVPVIVISKDSWGNRGKGIRDLGRTVTSLFQDYEAIKGSVVIIMNRFSKTEMDEMEHKFNNLIEEMESSDRTNNQYIAFLEHLRYLAREKELLTFDPLVDNPKELMNLLIKKPALTKPSSVFQDSILSTTVINTFCTETAKRIKYHLKANTPGMVDYFYRNLQTLNQILTTDLVEQQMKTICSEIEEMLRRDYNRIVEEFNFKVRSFSLKKEDIKVHFSEIRNMALRTDYDKILESFNIVKQSEINYSTMFKELSLAFMVDRSKEEEDTQNKGRLETMRLLYDERQQDEAVVEQFKKVKNWLSERIVFFVNSHSEALEKSSYDEAADFLEAMKLYSAYRPKVELLSESLNQSSPKRQNSILNRSVPEHAYQLVKNGKMHLTRCNINQLVEVDKRAHKLSNCYRLMGCLEPTIVQEVTKYLEEFNNELSKAVATDFETTVSILNKAKQQPIQKESVKIFEQCFRRLQEYAKVQSISFSVESYLERVKRHLESVIDGQRSILEKVSYMINKNPKQLKESIEEVQTALNGVEHLSKFGGEKIEASASQLIKRIIEELDTFLPKILDGLCGVKVLKFNADYEQIFQKICDASEMEKVFGKLQNFQVQHRKLENINKQNEEILAAALTKAMECVRTLEIKEETSTKETGTLYLNINLNEVEKALKFVDLISRQSPFQSSKEASANNRAISEKLLQDYYEYSERAIKCFGKRISEAEKYVPEQAGDQPNQRRQMSDLVGENCREAWRWAKRIYQQLRNIENKYSTIKDVGGFFTIDQLLDTFKEEVIVIYNTLLQSWGRAKNAASKFEEVCMMMRKCETFQQSDEEIIGSTAKDFMKLRNDIIERIDKIDTKAVSRVGILLQARSFSILKEHMEKLSINRGMDSLTYDEAMEAIQNFASKFLKEKRMELNTIRQKNISVTQIPNYVQTQQELQAFYECYKKEEVRKLKAGFEENLSMLLPNVTEELQNSIVNQSIVEAFKSLRQLESIQRNLEKKEGEVKDHLTTKYKGDIEALLTRIKTNIEQWDNPAKLNSFFKKNQREGTTKEINELKTLWEEKLAIKFNETIADMEKSDLRSTANSFRRLAQELSEYFPESLKDSRKGEITNKHVAVAGKIKEREDWLISKTNELVAGKRLEFDIIQKQLEHLQRQENEIMKSELAKAIKATWDVQRDTFLQAPRTVSEIVQFFLTEVQPFLKKVNQYEKLIGAECNRIKESFMKILQEEVSKLSSQIINRLQVRIQSASGVRQTSKALVNNFDSLFHAVTVCHQMDSVYYKDILVSAYQNLASATISKYEGAVSSIKLQEMFNKIDNSAEVNFQTVIRIGPVIEALQRQSRENVPARNGGDSQLEKFKANLSVLPKSEEIVKEFINKMEQVLQFVENFDILSSKHDSLDEREFGNLFRNFDRSVSNANSYLPIYELVEAVRVDIKVIENKLRDNAEQIFRSSSDTAKLLFSKQDDKVLRELNRQTLILRAFENSFPREPKYGQSIKIKIEYQVKLQNTDCDALINLCENQLKENDQNCQKFNVEEKAEVEKKNRELQQKCSEEMKKITDQIEREIKAKRQEGTKGADRGKTEPLSPQIQQQIEKLSKRKETEEQNKKKELENSKSEEKKKCQAIYAKKRQDLEKDCSATFLKLAKGLAQIKQVQVGIVIAKEECSYSLEKLVSKIKGLKVRFTNFLAKGLEDIGNSYAILLLAENPKIFSNYNVRKFKEMVANNGPEQVIDKIPYINQNLRKDIKKKYDKYQKAYTTWVQDYSKTPFGEYVANLKSSINSKANEVGRRYSASQSSDGFELLAEIFALWTIKKANVSEEKGVEFLFDPHPAQVIAILLILGICGGEQKKQLSSRIAQVLTGEGKSLILGVLSCYLALTGFDVYCMCYSRLLSQRDYDDFTDLFDTLGVKEYVTYGTFGEITEKIYNPKTRELRVDVSKILIDNEDRRDGFMDRIKGAITKPRQKVLLIDEVDVFFNKEFFGQQYAPSTEIRHEKIGNLATYVWTNREKVTYESLIRSSEFKACLTQFPRLEGILNSTAIDMVSSVKKFNHNYIIHQGKIGYVLPEGISFRANYGWRTIFAYFYEVGRQTIKVKPQDYASISILCCQLSYAELPREFAYVMGVTGTLDKLPKCQEEVLKSKEWYNVANLYYIPSVYGKSRRTKLGAQVVATAQYFTQICKAISNVQSKMPRPVFVFFDSIDKVNEFYLSPEFQELKENAITLTERNDPDAIKSRIIRATRAKNITIMTKAFGRGIDFMVNQKEVRQSGGVHVIQTFISEEQAESAQIEGRTGRQGGMGSYELIIDVNELQKIGLQGSQLMGKNALTVEQEINKIRNHKFEKAYAEQIREATKCIEHHKTAKQILSNIREGKNREVSEAVCALNRHELLFTGNGKTVRTVIGLDATGSMSGAIGQVLHNVKACLERTYNILREKKVACGFEIQIAIYRNYNSVASKLFQWSPFSNNSTDLINFLKGVAVDGGCGNEAIQNLYNHVLTYENDVDQIIVIGDAAGNTNAEIIEKRKSNRGETYWKNYPRFVELLNGDQLISRLGAKNIPVHSFYIGSAPAKYFQGVSKQTNGQSSEYNFNEPMAANKLTSFVVENILKRIGGDKRGEELVAAYRMRFSS